MPAFQAGDKSSILLRRTKMKFLQILSGGISFSEGVISQLLGLSENRIRGRETASSNARQFCDRFSYSE